MACASVSIVGVQQNSDLTTTIKAKITNPTSEDLVLENLKSFMELENRVHHKHKLHFKDVVKKNEEKIVELVVPAPHIEPLCRAGGAAIEVSGQIKAKIEIDIPFVGKVEVEVFIKI